MADGMFYIDINPNVSKSAGTMSRHSGSSVHFVTCLVISARYGGVTRKCARHVYWSTQSWMHNQALQICLGIWNKCSMSLRGVLAPSG